MTFRPSRVLVWAAILLPALIVGLGFAYQFGLYRFNYPVRTAYPVQGIDVSHHQGRLDWRAVPKGAFSFAYIKATEGADWVDPEFRRNWQGARDAGLKAGAYHFFSLCKSGLEQAQNFIGLVPLEPGMLPPVVDLELGGNCAARPPQKEVLSQLRQFMDLLTVTYGADPMLYTTYDFAALYLPASFLREERVWMRDIFRRPGGAFAGRWTVWQFANNGRVEGLGPRIDLSVFRGTPEEFRKLTIQPMSQFATASAAPRS